MFWSTISSTEAYESSLACAAADTDYLIAMLLSGSTWYSVEHAFVHGELHHMGMQHLLLPRCLFRTS